MMRRSKSWHNPNTQQLALDIAPPHNKEEAMMRAGRGLPENENDLIATARIALSEYDEAVKRCDKDGCDWQKDRIEAIGIKLNGGRIFRQQERERLGQLFAVDDGSVPIWGQPGRFIVTFPEFRALIQYQGLFDFGGHAFGAYAVDFDRPFISETGYRSFHPMHPLPDRDDGDSLRSVEAWAKAQIEKSRGYDRYGMFLRGKLAPLVKIDARRTRDHHAADDPAWQPGGWIFEAAQKDKPPMPARKPRTAKKAIRRGARRR